MDPNKAKATYKNGVLSVELEKVEKKKGGLKLGSTNLHSRMICNVSAGALL